jgi:hypothetical protein
MLRWKEKEYVPEKRSAMARIREVLRLHFEAQLKERQIAKIWSVGKGTVRRFLKRVAAASLSWPLPTNLEDATLEQRLFPPPPPAAPGSRPQPDFTTIHKELKSGRTLRWNFCGKNIIKPTRKVTTIPDSCEPMSVYFRTFVATRESPRVLPFRFRMTPPRERWNPAAASRCRMASAPRWACS